MNLRNKYVIDFIPKIPNWQSLYDFIDLIKIIKKKL